MTLTMSMINTIRFHDAAKDQETVTTKADVMSKLDLDYLDLVEIFLKFVKDLFLEFQDEGVDKCKTIQLSKCPTIGLRIRIKE